MCDHLKYQKELDFLEAMGIKSRVAQNIQDTFDRLQKEFGEGFDKEYFKQRINAGEALLAVAKAIKGFFNDDVLVKLTEDCKKADSELTIPGGAVFIQIVNNALNNYYTDTSPDKN